jgi:hypothetical protein
MSLGLGEIAGAAACLAVGGTCTALVCFSSDPIDGDPRAAYSRSWQTDLLNAPCVEPAWFCCAIVCEPCVQYKLRTWALGSDNMAAYRCCQGYFDTPCCRAGSCGDEGNCCCLAGEVLFCPCLAVQATRFYVMDTRNIAPSGTDNKLIRFNNALQLVACGCQMCDSDGADLMNLLADLMWTTLMGCMSAQVAAELKAEQGGNAQAHSRAPQPMVMARYPSNQIPMARPVASAPQPIAMGRPVHHVRGGNYVV